MALIEFLWKNWYILVILLALLSQLGKRSSRRTHSEGNGKPRMPAMPTFGGNPGMPGRMGGSQGSRPLKQERADLPGGSHSASKESSGSGFDSPQTTSKGALPDTERTLINAGASEPYLEEKERVGSPFSNAGNANKQADDINEKDEYSAPAASPALQTSSRQLAQGIIWAEILGPPRAKKPYRR